MVSRSALTGEPQNRLRLVSQAASGMRNAPGRSAESARNAHKLPHRTREFCTNQAPCGLSPNRNVGNPRFRKTDQQAETGRTAANPRIRDKLPRKFGTSPPAHRFSDKLPRKSGASPPTRRRQKSKNPGNLSSGVLFLHSRFTRPHAEPCQP